MIQHSINLPFGNRLDLHLVKNRRLHSDETPILPSVGEILRVKKGSKVSRIFRHIFEHEKARKLFGAQIALFLTASAFIPTASAIASPEVEEVLVSQTKLVLTTEKGVRYPVDNVEITQGYKFFHPGIDFDGLTGDPIHPVMSGIVEAVDYSKYAYGNAVYINHGSGVTSLYAHLSKIFVKVNDQVTTSSVIGEMGVTGRASGDHLHLEIRQYGTPVNPLSVLAR